MIIQEWPIKKFMGIVFYGPFRCVGCGALICRAARELCICGCADGIFLERNGTGDGRMLHS